MVDKGLSSLYHIIVLLWLTVERQQFEVPLCEYCSMHERTQPPSSNIFCIFPRAASGKEKVGLPRSSSVFKHSPTADFTVFKDNTLLSSLQDRDMPGGPSTHSSALKSQWRSNNIRSKDSGLPQLCIRYNGCYEMVMTVIILALLSDAIEEPLSLYIGWV